MLKWFSLFKLASNVYQSLQKKNPYASNWLERLRSIKRLRAKVGILFFIYVFYLKLILLFFQLIENQVQGGVTAAHADIDDRPSEALHKQNTNRDFTKYT